MKREILPAVSGAKAVQTAKGKYSTVTTSSKWVWDGIKWRYISGGTAHFYLYKLKLSWKKNSKAFGYVYSVDKSKIKTGSYIDSDLYKSRKVISSYYGFTQKNSIAFNYDISKKVSKAKVYVAPVNKYGYIGKIKTITVNVY